MAKVKATRVASPASKVTKLMDQWIKELSTDEELKDTDDIIGVTPEDDKYDKFIDSKHLIRFFNLFNNYDNYVQFVLSVKEDDCLTSTNKEEYLDILSCNEFAILFIRYHRNSSLSHGPLSVITRKNIKSIVETYPLFSLDNGDVCMSKADFWECIMDVVPCKCGEICISDTDENGYPIEFIRIHPSNISKYLDLSLNHTLFEPHLKYEDLISCEVELSSGVSHNVMARYRFPLSEDDNICAEGLINGNILAGIINRAFGCIPPYSFNIFANTENIDISVSFNNVNDVKGGLLHNSRIRTESVLEFITLMLRANYITRLHNKLLAAIGNMALYS